MYKAIIKTKEVWRYMEALSIRMPHSKYQSTTRLIPRFCRLHHYEPHGELLSEGLYGYTCGTPEDG